jgi:hypothetical protein
MDSSVANEDAQWSTYPANRHGTKFVTCSSLSASCGSFCHHYDRRRQSNVVERTSSSLVLFFLFLSDRRRYKKQWEISLQRIVGGRRRTKCHGRRDRIVIVRVWQSLGKSVRAGPGRKSLPLRTMLLLSTSGSDLGRRDAATTASRVSGSSLGRRRYLCWMVIDCTKRHP